MSNRQPIHVPLSLRRQFPSASFVACADVPVRRVVEDSRRVRPGDVFAVVRGVSDDGARYVSEAVRRGASALLVESPLPEAPLPQCVVPSVRSAYAKLVAALHGDPARHLSVVGVTGTNGKTTTSWLVRSILNATGRGCGLLGTVECDDGARIVPSSLTTPDAGSMATLLSSMVTNGLSAAAVEVSSHALDQERADGILLAAGIVTNVTHDHFDYHGDFETYLAAKARILDRLRPGSRLVVNAGNAGAIEVGKRALGRADVHSFGLAGESVGFVANIVTETLAGSEFEIVHNGEMVRLRTPLVGRHNVENALAAILATEPLGAGVDGWREGLVALDGVPGRLERVPSSRPVDVFVDYAHTPDALACVLSSLRPLVHGRLICVFGAGGDRDREKRPLLGRAATAADIAIVTSDNPRGERPEDIVEEILPGLEGGRSRVDVVLGRELAIARAVGIAEAGDCVVIAGKGHEREQVIGDERLPFDDRLVAREALLHSIQSRVPARVSA